MGTKKPKSIAEMTQEELAAYAEQLEAKSAENEQMIAEAEKENARLQAELKSAELTKGDKVVKIYKGKAYQFLAASFTIPGEEGVVKHIASELENDSPVIGDLIDTKSGLIAEVKEVK